MRCDGKGEWAVARGLALVALLGLMAGPALAAAPAGQELIVTRVERGRFPAVKLWLTPTNVMENDEEGETGANLFVARPGFAGKPVRFRSPRNIRNLAAWYLQAGDLIYCEKATREAKTNVWVLDGIQRLAPARPSKPPVRRQPKQVVDPLEIQVLTDKKRYQPGEPVRLTLRARNQSEKPMTLVFPTGETHHLLVTDGSSPVWSLSTLGMVTTKAVRRTLKPGEAIEFTSVWDQKREDGQEVAPGRYMVGGKIMSEGRTILEYKRVPFLIAPPEGQQPNG
jgi:hypothetical protein